MVWSGRLKEGERILWEGRPAPRCFVFRNWRHSLFGLLLLAFGIWWEVMGVNLGQARDAVWVMVLPVPFMLVGFYLAFGHLLKARLEWEKLFFAATDRRLLRQKGLLRQQVREIPLAHVTYFLYKPLSNNVGSLRIEAGERHPALVFSCVEHPQSLLKLLEETIQTNQQETTPQE
jgi:hypothetical protein